MKRKEVSKQKVEQAPQEEPAELDDVDGLFEDLTSTSSD
jgi:hypothetical protein